MSARILLIDDEPVIRTLISTRLKARGYSVITACDGKEGLDKWKSEHPDVVLLDVMMPEMDGFAVLKEVKRLKGGLNPAPVIMMTAIDEIKDTYKEDGAADYIIKPCVEEDLISKIEKYRNHES